MSTLGSTMIFLAAAVVAVPVFKKLKLGAILGYLVAGILIGPQVFNFIHDPASILKFAEIGIVLLLFIIGLDLRAFSNSFKTKVSLGTFLTPP